jgi:hypothetical protein
MAANLRQPFEQRQPVSQHDGEDQDYNGNQQHNSPQDPEFEDTSLDFVLQDEEPGVVLGRIEAEVLKLLRGLGRNPPCIPDICVVISSAKLASTIFHLSPPPSL